MSRSVNSNWQSGLIVALRFLIGWHLLFEGVSKLVHPEWSSVAFLVESEWIFSGIANWITSNQGVLNVSHWPWTDSGAIYQVGGDCRNCTTGHVLPIPPPIYRYGNSRFPGRQLPDRK